MIGKENNFFISVKEIMPKQYLQHIYKLELKWTGNTGSGTSSYEAYSRDHEIKSGAKTWVQLSSDPAFRGNPENYTPEEMLVASLSSCHMLWYLHLCSQHRITVLTYEDFPEGLMYEKPNGSGHFKQVLLKPKIIIKEANKIKKATKLHQSAHDYCFIANSVNFPVACEPNIDVENTVN